MVEPINPFEKKRIFTKSSTKHYHDIYLIGPIGSPDNYIEDFELIRGMGPSDIAHIHINSPGGWMVTALQYIRCMLESEGTIITSNEGECASAATMIFLSGHEFEVSPNSQFMIHNYSAGTYGKGNELWERAVNDKDWSDNLMRDYYRGFLEPDEIEKVIDGKDYYFKPDEVIARCGKMIEFRQAEAEELADECKCCEQSSLQKMLSEEGIEEIVVNEFVTMLPDENNEFSIYLDSVNGDPIAILNPREGLRIKAVDDDMTERDFVKILFEDLTCESLENRSTKFGLKRCQQILLEKILEVCGDDD